MKKTGKPPLKVKFKQAKADQKEAEAAVERAYDFLFRELVKEKQKKVK